MNHMEEVATMLGVKMGEKFRIKESTDVVYHFEKAGLIDGIGSICMTTLGYIISGAYHIEKFPWKPKNGDRYFIVCQDGCSLARYWEGSITDLSFYCSGNCFETCEESQLYAPEVIEKMRKKYEGNDK